MKQVICKNMYLYVKVIWVTCTKVVLCHVRNDLSFKLIMLYMENILSLFLGILVIPENCTYSRTQNTLSIFEQYLATRQNMLKKVPCHVRNDNISLLFSKRRTQNNYFCCSQFAHSSPIIHEWGE